VNAKLELEANLQPRASSPAQNGQDGGGEQIDTETAVWATQTFQGEQFSGEQWGEQQASVSDNGELAGTLIAVVSSPNKGEQTERRWSKHAGGEQRRRYTPPNKRPPGDRSSQWLKKILPAALNGWWDVRIKGERFTVKFRWRDPDLQVITLLRLHKYELEVLKQSCPEDARQSIREQVLMNLRSLLLDQTKRRQSFDCSREIGNRWCYSFVILCNLLRCQRDTISQPCDW
jgi:hypothetical protein